MIEVLWIAIIVLIVQISLFEAKERSHRPVKSILSGGLMSTGQIETKSITIELDNNLYALTARFKSLKSSNIIAETVRTKTLIAPLFIPNNDRNIININSYLEVRGEIKFEDEKVCTFKPKKRGLAKGTSFIQLKSMQINGVKQFRTIKEENLSDINSKLNTKFFDLLSNNTKLEYQSVDVTSERIIDINYRYDHVKLETQFSFVNDLWNGNNAFIKINDQVYWMDQHNWMDEDNIEEKRNICDNINFLEEKWLTPIRIIYRRPLNKPQEKTLKITFGYKFHPHNNLSEIELSKCDVLSKIKQNAEIITFGELSVAIK
jgi:hypothetical protein